MMTVRLDSSQRPEETTARGPVPHSARGRPILRIPASRHRVVLVFFGWVSLGGVALWLAMVWGDLPQRVPLHFDLAGRPDGWGDKRVLWLLPAVAAMLFVSVNWAARYPHAFNYPVPITEQNAERQYRIAMSMMNWLGTLIVLLLTGLLAMTVRVALGRAEGISTWFMVGGIVAITGVSIVHIVQALRAK